MKIKINKYAALAILYLPFFVIARLLHLPVELYFGLFFAGLLMLFIRDYRDTKKEVPKDGKK